MVVISLEVALEMGKKTSHPKPLGVATPFKKKSLKFFFVDFQGPHLCMRSKLSPLHALQAPRLSTPSTLLKVPSASS